MIVRSDMFQDRNEGVEQLLAQLEAVTGGDGCGGMGWHDAASALRAHDCVKASSYVSCWSKNADSVAMWSLYSADLQSVRVSTKASKLAQVAETLMEKFDVRRLDASRLGKMVVACIGGRIAPVNYESLIDIAKRLTKKAKAHLRIAERYKRQGLPYPSFPSSESNYWRREEVRSLPALKETGYLKDLSFKHEEEIRVSVRLGQANCVDKILSYGAQFDPNHASHTLLKYELNAWAHLIPGDVPQREFVDCSDDFIDSVAIDPRCPPHKAAFMRDWFGTNGISIEESNCFGYLPSTFKVFPAR